MRNFLIFIIALFSIGKMIAQSTWEKFELPRSVSPYSKLYCLDENKLFLFENSRCPGSIYQTNDGGKNWTLLVGTSDEIDGAKSGGDFTSAPMSFINKNIGFFVYACGLLKTTNSGNDWFVCNPQIHPTAIVSSLYCCQNILAIDEQNIWLLGDFTIGGHSIEFWRSSDGGVNFQKVEIYGTSRYLSIGYSNGVGYAVDGQSNVYTTTDKGETWNFVSSLFSNEMNFEVRGLYVFDSNKAFYGGRHNLIKTEDGFQSISSYPYPSANYWIFFTDSEHGMLSSGVRLYYTDDGGKNWSVENVFDEKIFHVTGKGNIWYALGRDALYKITKNLNISTKPTAIIQIYPNPVVDYFIIESEDKQVKQIEIYDIAGRVVVSQNFPEQNKINIQNLANGFYIAKIDMDNQIFQTKILKQ